MFLKCHICHGCYSKLFPDSGLLYFCRTNNWHNACLIYSYIKGSHRWRVYQICTRCIDCIVYTQSRKQLLHRKYPYMKQAVAVLWNIEFSVCLILGEIPRRKICQKTLKINIFVFKVEHNKTEFDKIEKGGGGWVGRGAFFCTNWNSYQMLW